MKDAASIIATLGGSGQVARDLGVAPQVVTNWAGRNAIPWERHTAILRLADSKGISLSRSQLEAIAAKRKAA